MYDIARHFARSSADVVSNVCIQGLGFAYPPWLHINTAVSSEAYRSSVKLMKIVRNMKLLSVIRGKMGPLTADLILHILFMWAKESVDRIGSLSSRNMLR